MTPYAGIGSRSTPPNICALMSQIAYHLTARDYTLRSSGTQGADLAFYMGARSAGGQWEVFKLCDRYDLTIWQSEALHRRCD